MEVTHSRLYNYIDLKSYMYDIATRLETLTEKFEMKKSIAISICLIFTPLIAVQLGQSIELILPKDTPVQACFSPQGGCTDAIIGAIDKAKTEILIQAYSFTSAPIAQALIKAHKRGIAILAILDKSQKKEKYSAATFLSRGGIPTYVDSSHAIAHNKIMIIDRDVLITGSFNFTKAAEEKNAENLLIIKSREMAQYFLNNWERHREHSEEFKSDN